MRAHVVDLFCGIGGLSLGFRNEGFQVVAGVDSDSSCEYPYEKNIGAKFVCSDIQSLSDRKLRALFPKKREHPRVLIGCAPCQPFSMYTDRYRKGGRRRDSQWKLLDDFARAVRATKPEVVSMENVARVTRHAVFKRFTRGLEKIGYRVSFQVVRAHDYGVPQRRSRLVMLASRLGEITLIEPTHGRKPRTVKDAIGNLPPIPAGGVCKNDPIHRSRALTPLNLERIKATKQGGGWGDWDTRLQLKCHKKKSGTSFRAVYGRMRWNKPSPVITTQCLGIGNGRFGHPTQNRAISIREAALLQSFPRKFQFVAPGEPVSGVALARQIGNAVPVALGQAIARSIRNHLDSEIEKKKSERQKHQ
jgi:DNA (cytosine-5)-methyltransferase 1